MVVSVCYNMQYIPQKITDVFYIAPYNLAHKIHAMYNHAKSKASPFSSEKQYDIFVHLY